MQSTIVATNAELDMVLEHDPEWARVHYPIVIAYRFLNGARLRAETEVLDEFKTRLYDAKDLRIKKLNAKVDQLTRELTARGVPVDKILER